MKGLEMVVTSFSSTPPIFFFPGADSQLTSYSGRFAIPPSSSLVKGLRRHQDAKLVGSRARGGVVRVLANPNSGCCKPSNDCNFTYVSPTNWTKTACPYTNEDCNVWDNKPETLCYDCQACKAGLLDNLKNSWKKVAQFNIVFLIIVYSVGCCARSGTTGNAVGSRSLCVENSRGALQTKTETNERYLKCHRLTVE